MHHGDIEFQRNAAGTRDYVAMEAAFFSLAAHHLINTNRRLTHPSPPP
jgi:hypothetical protein